MTEAQEEALDSVLDEDEDEDEDEVEQPPPPPPTPPARLWAMWLIVALVLLAVTAGVLLTASPTEVAREVSTSDDEDEVPLDAELEFSASPWDGIGRVSRGRLKRAARIARDRLKAAKIPHEVEVSQRKGLVVKLAKGREEEAIHLLLQRAEVRFHIVVGEELSDREEQISRVLKTKRDRSWSEDDRYNVFPLKNWDPKLDPGPEGMPDILVHQSPPNVRRGQWVSGESISDVKATLDSRGEAAIEVTFDDQGRTEMFFMTNPKIGAKLAIVIDGEIVARPEIVSTIRRILVIPGGPKGWDKEERKLLINAIKGGEMPLRLKLTSRK